LTCSLTLPEEMAMLALTIAPIGSVIGAVIVLLTWARVGQVVEASCANRTVHKIRGFTRHIPSTF
jgi:hypothetical protein